MKIAKFSLAMLVALTSLSGVALAQSITGVKVPLYMQGISGTNNSRIPAVYGVTFSGLTASATYRFYNSYVNGADGATATGAGSMIYVNTSGAFGRSTQQTLATLYTPGATANSCSQFTTDGTGSATMWMIGEPTGNAKFGATLWPRINLNNGAGGTSVVTRLSLSSDTQTPLAQGAGASNGTGLVGTFPTGSYDKNMVLFYDNVDGSGRPISATFAENDGLVEPAANFASYYVDATANRFNGIIPNTLPNGIRRVEIRSTSNPNTIVKSFTDADGVWAGGSTVNPTGGLTPVTLNSTDLSTSVNVTGPSAIVDATSYDFGNVVVGSYSQVTFTITTSAPGSSTLGSFSSSNSEFTIQGATPTFIDGTGGTTSAVTFTVRFTPSGLGATSTNFSFSTQDDNAAKQSYDILMTGTGSDYAAGIPSTNGSGANAAWTPALPVDPNTGNQRPLNISFPAGTGNTPGVVQVSYSATSPNMPAFASENLHRYWNIDAFGASNFDATLSFRFTLAEDVGGIHTSSLIQAARSTDNGMTWTIFATNLSATDLGGGVYEVVVPNVNAFSEWTLGTGTLLPVHLSAFTATPMNDGIELNWRTETEVQTDRFVIERRASGDNSAYSFEIASQSQNGNSTQPLSYRFVDREHLIKGATYNYRLIEVDLAGNRTQLRSVNVVFQSNELMPNQFGLIKAFPNPFNPTTTVQIKLREAGLARVAVYDLEGRLVQELYNGMLSTNAHNFTFDASKLASGIYMVKVNSARFSSSKKIVLVR